MIPRGMRRAVHGIQRYVLGFPCFHGGGGEARLVTQKKAPYFSKKRPIHLTQKVTAAKDLHEPPKARKEHYLWKGVVKL